MTARAGYSFKKEPDQTIRKGENRESSRRVGYRTNQETIQFNFSAWFRFDFEGAGLSFGNQRLSVLKVQLRTAESNGRGMAEKKSGLFSRSDKRDREK